MLLHRTPLPNPARGNSVPLALSATRALAKARQQAGYSSQSQHLLHHHDAGLPSRAGPRAHHLRPNPEPASANAGRPRNAPRNGINTGCALTPLTRSHLHSNPQRQYLRLSSSLASIISRPSPAGSTTVNTTTNSRQGRSSHALDSSSATSLSPPELSRLKTTSPALTSSPLTSPSPSPSALRALHSSASPPGMYTTSFAFFESLGEAGISHVFVNLGSDHPSIIEAMVKGSREKNPNFPRIITCPNEVRLVPSLILNTNTPSCRYLCKASC